MLGKPATWPRDLSFGFLNGFWWWEQRGRGHDCTRSSRDSVLLCVCRQGGHSDGLQQRGGHACANCQTVTRALEGEIWCGKEWLEDADEAEGRAAFRNEIHFVFVGTVKGWDFMELFWRAFFKDFDPFTALGRFPFEHVTVVRFW